MDTNRLPKATTTCTEDGHKQTTKSDYNMYRGWAQTDYQKWLQHVQRMDTNRLPKQALQYKPRGRRNIGRPRKRWRDQLHLEDQGTGNTPNPSGTWWWWWRQTACCTGQFSNCMRVNTIGQECQSVSTLYVILCVLWTVHHQLEPSRSNLSI